MRQALADRWLGGRVDSALVTHGSSEALYLIMTSLLAPGDEVLVLDPCYPQHASIAEALGCRIRCWSLRFENGFRPDLAELRGLLGPRTRMIVANFPHNPTGATLTPDEREELLRLAEEANLYLVWDGAFSALTYEVPPLSEPPLDSGWVLSIGTLSKAYGLPGLRVGWCLGAPGVLRRLVETRDHVTLHLSPLVELVAARVIRHGERLIAPRLAQARRNRELLAEWIEGHPGLVEWVPAAGASAPSSVSLRYRMLTPSAIASPGSTGSSWSRAPVSAIPVMRASGLVAGLTPSRPASPGFPPSCAPFAGRRGAGTRHRCWTPLPSASGVADDAIDSGPRRDAVPSEVDRPHRDGL